MGARRGGRDDSPLAGLLRRSPAREAAPEREERKEGNGRDAPEVGEGRRTVPRSAPRTEARRVAPPSAASAKKKRGRPRGGRRSNPDYVQISARIHKDVRFSFERVLAERSEVEGRYVEMAEVLEHLMRFYVENGDPHDLLKG